MSYVPLDLYLISQYDVADRMRIKESLIVLFFLSALAIFSNSYAFAQEIAPSTTIVLSPTAVPVKIQYELPYPGMLPDNPLYFAKAFRDRLIGLLINNPLKKAQFNLLTSDKRLNAGQALLARGKKQDAVSVVSKSNNYLELAIEAARGAQKNGENIRDIMSQIQTSGLKHKEVINQMMLRVDKKNRTQLKKELDRITQFNKTISKLLKSGV